jgi:hypothetical protein
LLLTSIGKVKKGTFALSYPLSPQSVDGIADTAGKKGPPPELRIPVTHLFFSRVRIAARMDIPVIATPKPIGTVDRLADFIKVSGDWHSKNSEPGTGMLSHLWYRGTFVQIRISIRERKKAEHLIA